MNNLAGFQKEGARKRSKKRAKKERGGPKGEWMAVGCCEEERCRG
jgi:hypothetical protein